MTHILLIGDSLVADHDWQSRMPGYKVHNLGVPGVMTSDLLSSLPQIKQQVKHADLIMIMIGTNDLLTGNFDFVHTLKRIFVQLSHDYPMAEILANSLFPMNLPHLPYNTIQSLNCHIEAITMQTGCCFLDTHKRFINSSTPLFQDDGVHITSGAYEIWTRALLEYIAFLIDSD